MLAHAPRGVSRSPQRGGLPDYVKRGRTFGLPLLHPWANRLDGLRYEAAGRTVEIDPDVAPVRLDENGLPNHGVLGSAVAVAGHRERMRGRRLSLGADLDSGPASLLAAFPFPHHLSVEMRLQGPRADGLPPRVRADEAGPDLLRLASLPPRCRASTRAEWEVQSGCARARCSTPGGIPTGETEPRRSRTGRSGERSFDDFYPELADPPEPRSGTDAGLHRRPATRRAIPCAQVYAPPEPDLICFEPMTAPVNALLSGDGLTLLRRLRRAASRSPSRASPAHP